MSYDPTLEIIVREHKELWLNLGDFDFANPLQPRTARIDYFHRALVEDDLAGECDYYSIKQIINMLGW